MKKTILITLGVVVAIYLCAVVVCNAKHNTLGGMNPCGSCWALDLLEDK